MERKPEISLIIPVYNAEKYLPDCLNSLLAQGYEDFELILVNDGSPDNSWQIMQEYSQKDNRVRIFQKENGGVSSARNFGLEQARGEYIGFVDADDLVVPQYLEWMHQTVRDADAKIVVCDYTKCTERECSLQLPEICPKGKVVLLEDCTYGGMHGVSRQCWGALYQRSLLQGIRFSEELSIGEDTLFFLEAFLRAGKYVRLESSLYFYIQTENSAYRADFTPRKYTEIEAWKKILKKTKAVPGPLHASAERILLYSCCQIYYEMLNSHYQDKALSGKIVDDVRQHQKAVFAMQTSPRWMLQNKAKLLSMLYLPAWFNGPVWRLAEHQHTK